MTRYIVIFTVTNLVMTIAIGVVTSIFNLKSGSGMAIGAAVGASVMAASSFVKAHARAPTLEETKDFAWRALLATWLVSLVLTAIVVVVLMPASEARGLWRGLTSGMGLVFFLECVRRYLRDLLPWHPMVFRLVWQAGRRSQSLIAACLHHPHVPPAKRELCESGKQ